MRAMMIRGTAYLLFKHHEGRLYFDGLCDVAMVTLNFFEEWRSYLP